MAEVLVELMQFESGARIYHILLWCQLGWHQLEAHFLEGEAMRSF